MESIPSSPVVKKPGETLSLSCRGSGFTFSSNAMHWIRQPAGKALEWIGNGFNDASRNTYVSSLRGRLEITKDSSNSVVYMRLSSLRTEDSAVYYCARDTVVDMSMEAVQKRHRKYFHENLKVAVEDVNLDDITGLCYTHTNRSRTSARTETNCHVRFPLVCKTIWPDEAEGRKSIHLLWILMWKGGIFRNYTLGQEEQK